MLKHVSPVGEGRRLVRREAIGMAAKIVQAEALDIPHLSIDMAGILRVTRGRKRVRGHGVDITFAEGDIALFGGGGAFDVLNVPERGAPYRAEAVFFELAALPALAEAGTKTVSGVARMGAPKEGLIKSLETAGGGPFTGATKTGERDSTAARALRIRPRCGVERSRCRAAACHERGNAAAAPR
jgi:hypothetical protein